MSHRVDQVRRLLRWGPGFVAQWGKGTFRRPPDHVMISVADHFEPSFRPDAPSLHAPLDQQEERLERWCREYPRAVEPYRDADGRTFAHTYFFPAEQAEDSLLDRLAEHCREGWGEAEIHLHHGVDEPDTAENTREMLAGFRDALAERGCLCYEEGSDQPRYAFVHGNWALANSLGGWGCGVDEEMAILAETGCYADMTLPSPVDSQPAKSNALYEISGDLRARAAFRTGRDLSVGRAPSVFPLMMQGPLGLFRRDGTNRPYIEQSEIASRMPPTLARFRRWTRMGIGVAGRPEWAFVKLHCHGMDTRDESVMFGDARRAFLEDLLAHSRAGGPALHFCTAREMVNIALAACDGREGDPGEYRDYRFKLRCDA